MKAVLFIVFFVKCSALYGNSQKDTLRINVYSGNNDYHKIQNALNTNTNKVLKVILNGTFSVTKLLSTSKPHTVIAFGKTGILRLNGNSVGGVIIRHDNCSILNGKIIGSGISSKNFYQGYGVFLYGVENCRVINNSFERISGHNIYLGPNEKNKGCSNNIISNNKILNPSFYLSVNGTDEAGILLGYSGNAYSHNNNIIENNYIDGADILKIGIGIIGHGFGNIFRKNVVKNCLNYGIIVYESLPTDTSLYNNYILNNDISNIGELLGRTTVKGMGIYLMKSSNSSVIGNRVNNTLINSDETETLGAGAISISLSPNCIVDYNFIDGSYMYGIVSDYSFGSKFTNNVIQHTRKSGAYFINMNDVIVAGNTFRNIGAVVLKGYFENTSLPYIQEQMRIDKYKNLNTGNNFKITDNTFYTDKDILYFVGSDKDAAGRHENKIKNNTVTHNKIFGNSRNLAELINFRKEVSGTNSIRRNKITN